MVQVIQTGKSRAGKLSETLGNALGQGLGEFVGQYHTNKALDSVLNDESLKKAKPSERFERLQAALRPYGERGEKVLMSRLQQEQMAQQEAQQEQYAKSLGMPELGNIPIQNQQKFAEAKAKQKAGSAVKQSLLKAGYPEETADLWQAQFNAAPTGGETHVIKDVNDLLRRSPLGKGIGEQQRPTTKPSIEIPGMESKPLELDFPDIPEPLGLTPADIVKQNEAREKVNTPIYKETLDRQNALDDEYRDIGQLKEYNDTPGALPSGSQKWNVDWETGDLRVKALATPEAQDFVKIIARMARKAKEFFPGRVTNFDLQQFKEGFATLANSEQGRSLILKQIQLANRIAYLKDEVTKAAFDHYGSGADPMAIQRYAAENYRRLKGPLENELRETNKQAEAMKNQMDKQSKPLVPMERVKVPQGTKLTNDVIDKYLDAAGNPEEARKMAQEDGYEF